MKSDLYADLFKIVFLIQHLYHVGDATVWLACKVVSAAQSLVNVKGCRKKNILSSQVSVVELVAQV